jgi:hypothetical protein
MDSPAEQPLGPPGTRRRGDGMSVQSKRTSPHAGDYPDPPAGPWVWARALGTVVAALSAIANFLWLPYYPVWSVILIGLAITVI